MPLPKPPAPDENNSHSTPAHPKPSTAPNTASTPRRASAKCTQNGGTPLRKVSANKTPTSAPARKKPEPTLLGDFLLGRPSPQRVRRKSLDLVKAEMKTGVVSKVKEGKVKDRITEWQKASAGAALIVPDEVRVIDELDEVDEHGESADDGAGEDERLRIRHSNRRPGRRKERNDEGEEKPMKVRSKSLAAPKKRVVSDDHWMKSKERKKSPPRQGVPIPKNFLHKTAENMPLEKKMAEWRTRTAEEEEEEEEQRPRRRKPRPLDGRLAKSRAASVENGARVCASPAASQDNGVRRWLAQEKESEDAAHTETEPYITDDKSEHVETPTRRERRPRSKRQSKDPDPNALHTPKKRTLPLRPPMDPARNRTIRSPQEENEVDEDKLSCRSRSPAENAKEKSRRSKTPPPESLSDIPFGNSAFSVLDIPVGADAGTMRRPPPKRNSSFAAVPKVLKKVYNVGKDIVQDTVDPPRMGVNQPPSIESWLNATSDPFIDRPSLPTDSALGVPASSSSRRRSFKEDDEVEQQLAADHEKGKDERNPTITSSEQVKSESPAQDLAMTRETLPSMEKPAQTSPIGLKRSPATRNVTSPKSGRKPLKDSIFGAFKGESATYHPLSAEIIAVQKETIALDQPEAKPRDERRSSGTTIPPRSNPSTTESTSRRSSLQHERPIPPPPRRAAPTTGFHRLSTIASAETLTASSSASESAGAASDISKSTVTQDTVITGPTESNLSRKTSTGLKRRLTMHSDLISMLSLPDNTAPGRSKSIRSARSVRTTRSHTHNATVQDLMRELAEDETKYIRELRTLVDGVIPVLLTCVLSKADSAAAAGILTSTDQTDSSLTRPIIDMGVALEKLKSLHKRIPLHEAASFLLWAQQAHKTYEDYLKVWRMGFQDVVVNLAPAVLADDSSLLDGMSRNKDGDVINASGERVDVAYLLKRPLVRVKYLSKLTKSVDRVRPTDVSRQVKELYEDLESFCRRRAREEQARMVDKDANSTDASRARDPRTLVQIEDVAIDPSRQVCAKDFFSFDMKHSNGQRIECRVEMLLRDKPADQSDGGDVLVCAADDNGRWLLFPPITRDLVSARIGDHMGQVVIMIRGNEAATEWRETFIVETDDSEAATEWVDMLGTDPMPPLFSVVEDTASCLSVADAAPKLGSGSSTLEDVEIPIGERRRQAAEETPAARRERRRVARQPRTLSGLPESIKEETAGGESVRDLNDAMSKAGTLLPESPVRHARARYHARSDNSPTPSPQSSSSGRLEMVQPEDDKVRDATDRSPKPNALHVMSGALPYLEKAGSLGTPGKTQPVTSVSLDESMRPEPEVLKKLLKPTPTRIDGAPPPPLHRTPVSSSLGKTPSLDSPTPKAKTQRSSSPLKHEYQPSDASGTSSSSEASDSEDDGTLSDSSDDDDLEAAELPEITPSVNVYGKRASPAGSFYSLPNNTLAPSNSASQAPYRGVPVTRTQANTKRNTATISSWSNKKGRWEDLHPGPCSVVVGPGLIEAFELGEAHSCPPSRDGPLESSGASDINGDDDAGTPRPLVALVLTPLVSLRQSTALDIEIQSPPTARSRLKCSGTVRYRAANHLACQELYQAIHRARLDNPVYKKLEQERIINSYGTHSYEAAIASNRRRSWFGRRKSYRASTRAPSATISDGSVNSSSAFSTLKRLSGGGIFNIAKSSIDTASGRQGYNSGPTSSYGSSDSSGLTPPRTPTSPSLSGTTNSNAISHNLGSENLKIRLYCLETSSKWNDIGAARLTVTQPPPGMRQASALYHGLEKRIIVTRKPPADKTAGSVAPSQAVVLLDVVLGSACFSKIGRTGIVLNVWEDVVGDDGTVGMVGKVGGLSGRTRKWLFQCGCAADAEWIFGLVACGR